MEKYQHMYFLNSLKNFMIIKLAFFLAYFSYFFFVALKITLRISSISYNKKIAMKRIFTMTCNRFVLAFFSFFLLILFDIFRNILFDVSQRSSVPMSNAYSVWYFNKLHPSLHTQIIKINIKSM